MLFLENLITMPDKPHTAAYHEDINVRPIDIFQDITRMKASYSSGSASWIVHRIQ
jgi:hypothetical protein